MNERSAPPHTSGLARVADFLPGVRAALVGVLLTGCALPLETTVANVGGNWSGLDEEIYRVGLACYSEDTPLRASAGASGCPENGLRALRAFFAARTHTHPLRAYLRGNRATCNEAAAWIACDYSKTVARTPRIWGGQVNPTMEERFELKLKFPRADQSLMPDQIQVELRRFSRAAP